MRYPNHPWRRQLYPKKDQVFRVPLTKKEYEAIRMSHADAFCTFEKDEKDTWRDVAVFNTPEDIQKAYRSLRDREPSHSHISTPYKSACKKLAIMLFTSTKDEVHAHGK